MTTRICSVTKKDLDALIRIYASPDLKVTEEESSWFVDCYFDYHHIDIAKANGEIKGACFWRLEGEKYCGLGWIENIWVEEDYRRKGLGERLLRKSIRDMMAFFQEDQVKLRKVVLTTQNSRLGARRLYERVGFKKAAVLEEAYGPGDSDIIYILDLRR